LAFPNPTKNLAGDIQSGTNAGKNERSPEACIFAGFRADRLWSFDTMIGVHATTLGRIEKGQTRKIGSDVLADTSENCF